MPNRFYKGSLHFEEATPGCCCWKTNIRFWHPNLQSVYHNNKVCDTLWCFKTYMVSFQTSVQMIFTSAKLPHGYSGLLHSLIKLLLKSVLMRLHRKWQGPGLGSTHFIPLPQCLLFQYWSNSRATSQRHVQGKSFSTQLRAAIKWGWGFPHLCISLPLHRMMERPSLHCSP